VITIMPVARKEEFEALYTRVGLFKVSDKPAIWSTRDPNAKTSLLAQYQNLLMTKPFTMNLVQSGTIAAAGNVTAQLISGDGTVTAQPVIEQLVLCVCFIAPVVGQWFPILGSLRLHWTLATAVDQFLFSPVFNIAIFWFISAFFKGGVTLSARQHGLEVCEQRLFAQSCSTSDAIERYELSLLVTPGSFPALAEYAPVWSTQVNAYYLWLPATVVREAFVPDHLKGLFVNFVSFIWSIIFSFILAASV